MNSDNLEALVKMVKAIDDKLNEGRSLIVGTCPMCLESVEFYENLDCPMRPKWMICVHCLGVMRQVCDGAFEEPTADELFSIMEDTDLWRHILDHRQMIRELRSQLADLPAEFS